MKVRLIFLSFCLKDKSLKNPKRLKDRKSFKSRLLLLIDLLVTHHTEDFHRSIYHRHTFVQSQKKPKNDFHCNRFRLLAVSSSDSAWLELHRLWVVQETRTHLLIEKFIPKWKDWKRLIWLLLMKSAELIMTNTINENATCIFVSVGDTDTQSQNSNLDNSTETT